VANTDESGLTELFDQLGDVLSDVDVVKEKKHMEMFLRDLVNDTGRASYGEEQVRKNLQMDLWNYYCFRMSFEKCALRSNAEIAVMKRKKP